jgi:hypothetical protein
VGDKDSGEFYSEIEKTVEMYQQIDEIINFGLHSFRQSLEKCQYIGENLNLNIFNIIRPREKSMIQCESEFSDYFVQVVFTAYFFAKDIKNRRLEIQDIMHCFKYTKIPGLDMQ